MKQSDLRKVPFGTLTPEQAEAGRSARGGFTYAQMKKWGVPIPPPRGWLKRLTGRSTGEFDAPDEQIAKIRYATLEKYGVACQCCGRSPKAHGVELRLDRIKPVSRYPDLEFDPTNFQILCDDCKVGKDLNDSETDWRGEVTEIDAEILQFVRANGL